MRTGTKRNGSVVIQFDDEAEKTHVKRVLGTLEGAWGDSGNDMRDLYTLEGFLEAIINKIEQLGVPL